MDPIEATKELSFRVGFSGHSGHLRVEPLSTVERSSPVRSLPDFILPPAFPKETPETIKGYIEETYLQPRLDPDEFSPEKVGRQWDFDWFEMAKVSLDPSQPRSVVVPTWVLPFERPKKDGTTGGTWEPCSVQVDVSELNVEAQESGSQPRVPGPAKDFLQMQGLDLGDLKEYPNSWNVYEDQSLFKTSPVENLQKEMSVQFDDLFKKAWEEEAIVSVEDGESPKAESIKLEVQVNELEGTSIAPALEKSVLDEILSLDSGGLSLRSDQATDHGREQKKEAWVVVGGREEISLHFHELVPDMALDFPFELDTFQKEAIYHLEKGDSVFVAAHTSAGKTVVAEYAFALATKHCTRAVYTAPIKTISNQKYRDFCGKFDVGLLTGDVSLRPEASCLIMTTEILRSMLYRGADIIRDIEWVIFDEVHYVNDVERGVVWEEVIIMLPRHINIVLLSATVPNTIEFADWIGRTKQKRIHVTGTTKRPVPLEHCIFYSGESYKICENEIFLSHGLKAAKDASKKKTSSVASGSHVGASASNDGARNRKNESFNRIKQNKHSGSQNLGNFSGTSWGNQKNGDSQNNWGSRRSDASSWLLLINKLSKKSLLPVVIFCFSKNRCDKSADSIYSIDLTSSSEKSEIRVFCDKAFSRLKGSDRTLPQIVRVQGLLHRGIGVHHAGFLPIVKEVVEMLFCRGVIKVLFSTETFAMGVNAPARTVVFDTLRKFDGKEFRQLLPGEYTQMAGRAGRRGLDKIGTVIVMCRDEIPEEKDLKRVIVGSATKLESQFRLTYIMILHLLRVEELKVEDMLKRSFAEFHAQKKLPEKQQLLMRKLAQPTRTVECIKGEPAIEEYYDLYAEAEKNSNQVSEAVMQSSAIQQFLTPGRVVVVKSQSDKDHLLSVIVKALPMASRQYIVLVLKPDSPPVQSSSSDDSVKKKEDFPQGYFMVPKSKRGLENDYYSPSTRKGSGVVNIRLPHAGAAAGVSYEVRGVDAKEFVCVCNKKIQLNPGRLLEDVNNVAYSQTVQQLLDIKSDGKFPPALDPLKDLKLKDVNLVEAYKGWTGLVLKMVANKCHGCIKLGEHLKLAAEIKKHKEEVNNLKFQMSDEALQQMPDFQGRIDVLKEIGCINADLVVQIKGRVACEMNSGEELICTECLFENQLDDLEPEEAVALMSAFVFQQRNTSEPSLTPKLSMAKKRLYETAIRLGKLQAQFRLPVDCEEYARDNLKFGLVEVVYEWAKGTPFADICELTDVPEGMIVRTIVRLDETCREFKNAAAIMGNSALHKKMETASNAIKRDIVFSASLYITGL
ncbi:DExH-box ATP-dependent RNA helicase DExH11, partial [Cucurbita argyrosperma subsp. sororia]